VKQEDVVINFDGERVRSAAQFTRLVRETAPGRTVEMTVTRGGARQTFDVMPEPQRAADFGVPNLAWSIRPALPRGFTFDFDGRPLLGALSPRRLGVTVSPLTPQLATYFGVTQGVLVTEVASSSPAEAAGIRAGDVITTINDRAVSAADDLVRGVREADAGSSLELRVMRERKELTMTVMLPEPGRPTVGGGRPV
jgi:S1-C subfamily serine protease